MAKRKLTRRQAWRIEKVQKERVSRAEKKDARLDDELTSGELGAEKLGLVIAHYGTQIAVEPLDDEGGNIAGQESIRCHMRANLGSLVTGDKVVWREGESHGVIVAVLERTSELSRPDPYGDMKTVAANIDRIIIVIAPYPEPHASLVDRYLVAAETLDIKPIILCNKVDRIDDDNREALATMERDYSALGYDWLNCSASTQQGLQPLIDYLASFTSVFVGQSGVGKSSLINMLLPNKYLKVGPLSAARQEGTHTTTTAQLFHFPGGGDLIDSPGIRELGLWHMDKHDLLQGFIEFRPFIGHCKFRDCAHQQEPKCAILDALARGDINKTRMNSYRHILSTLGSEL